MAQTVRAVVVGLAVALAGTLPWVGLIKANVRFVPSVPWSVPVMALVLAAWWLYFVRGRGWPEGTGRSRRLGSRANAVPAQLWGPALGTGILGLLAMLLFQGVLGRLVTLPQQRDLDPSKYPMLTVVAWVVMGGLVAGVVEETAFRGYMQSGIERRHGVATAILVTGVAFGLSHFTHPEVGIVLLPYYLAVAAVYGLLAAATDSTFPSMALHAGGNMFSAFALLSGGRSQWQMTSSPQPTIWQSGVDASFLANLFGFVVAAVVAGVAYRALFSAARASRTGTA